MAGLERQVADNPVALVEKAEHRDPIGHRRHAWLVGAGARNVDRDCLTLVARRGIPAAGAKRRQRNQDPAGAHAYSGFHAW